MLHSNSTPAPRLGSLDALRAVAFLAVFFHHALALPLLWAGVDVFFVLSGFLITGILRRTIDEPHSLRKFYGRRFLRIFPPYYLSLAVVMFLFPERRQDWLWYVTYTSNILDSFAKSGQLTVLGPMWSLSVEEQFYLAWPLLVLTTSRRTMLWICGGVIVGALIGRMAGTTIFHDWSPIYHFTLFRFDLLAAGALVSLLLETGGHSRRALRRAGLTLTLLGGLPFLLLAHRVPGFRTTANSLLFNGPGYTMVGMVAVGALLLTLGVDGWPERILTRFPLPQLGIISYAAYLVHQPAILLSRLWTPNRWASTAIAFGATICIATLSYWAMERPLLRLKDRWFAYRRRDANIQSPASSPGGSGGIVPIGVRRRENG